MFNSRVNYSRVNLGFPLALIEFLARIGSIASIVLLLMLFAGEGLHPSQVATKEWIGLLFFPLGVRCFATRDD